MTLGNPALLSTLNVLQISGMTHLTAVPALDAVPSITNLEIRNNNELLTLMPLSGLTSLVRLHVGANPKVSTIPEFGGNLTGLTSLGMYGMVLVKVIPSTQGSTLSARADFSGNGSPLKVYAQYFTTAVTLSGGDRIMPGFFGQPGSMCSINGNPYTWPGGGSNSAANPIDILGCLPDPPRPPPSPPPPRPPPSPPPPSPPPGPDYSTVTLEDVFSRIRMGTDGGVKISRDGGSDLHLMAAADVVVSADTLQLLSLATTTGPGSRACDASSRGSLLFQQDATNGDALHACVKLAGGAFAWKQVTVS